LQDPVLQITNILSGIHDYDLAVSELGQGNVNFFLIWFFYLSLSIIQLLCITFLLWVLGKHFLLGMTFSDKREGKKSVILLLVCCMMQWLSGVSILYPLFDIRLSF